MSGSKCTVGIEAPRSKLRGIGAYEKKTAGPSLFHYHFPHDPALSFDLQTDYVRSSGHLMRRPSCGICPGFCPAVQKHGDTRALDVKHLHVYRYKVLRSLRDGIRNDRALSQ